MAIEIEPLGADKLLDLWLETRETGFRDQLVAHYLPLACRLCHRFQNLGEAMDDLIPAGVLGLMKAIDRYEPRNHKKFTAFAIPVILGEIKAHFRLHGWGAMVPGKLQLRKLLVDRIVETLTQQMGRSPTVPEIGEAAGLSEEEVFQTFEVDRPKPNRSLITEPAADQSKQYTHIRDHHVEEDPGLKPLTHDIGVRVTLSDVDPREQIVLYLKLYSGLSESAIALRLGISQMHVSRLQRNAVANLRLSLRERVPC